MYTSFFGLNEKPFSITPDPRYLYMSERHAEALAHLIYGVKESGGFIQLTGEVGTGKTTLVRSLLQQLPDFADVAVVLNSQLSRVEFLSSICEELHLELPEQRNSIKALTDALNVYLLKNHSQGRRTILIVDEAQNLRVEVLEQVRLLTNLETAKQKLLQIILIGQPELRELLGAQRHAAARPAHHGPLPPGAADPGRDHRLHRAPAQGRRRHRPDLLGHREARAVPPVRRRAPHDQRDRRPGPARRLHHRRTRGDARTRPGGGGRGLRQAAGRLRLVAAPLVGAPGGPRRARPHRAC